MNTKKGGRHKLKTILGLLFFAVIIMLQIYVSKNKRKIGLVLPAIVFLLSIVIPIGSVPFNAEVQNEIVSVSNSNGEIIEEKSESKSLDLVNTSIAVNSIISSFLLYNVLTLILVFIYLFYAQKRRNNRALNKMKVIDIE